MKLAFSNKILSYYEDAQKLAQGQLIYPRMALIYLTYACNYKCPHCLYKGWNNGHHYPTKKLFRLMDELAACGVKALEFCGGGEPTMHPNFIEIVRHARRLKFELGLLTNGSRLHEFYHVISHNFSYVRISIDTTNVEEYKHLHGIKQDMFPIVCDGIQKLVADIRQNHLNCKVGLKALLTKNGLDIDSLVNLKLTLGTDYIQFKAARNCPDAPSDEQICYYHNKIAQYNDSSIKDGLSKSQIACQCFLTPIHTMIDAYGDMYLCCYYQYREKSHKFGNVLNTPFQTVWNSHKHHEARRNIQIPECNVYDCRFHGYNSTMEGILKHNDYHLNFI